MSDCDTSVISGLFSLQTAQWAHGPVNLPHRRSVKTTSADDLQPSLQTRRFPLTTGEKKKKKKKRRRGIIFV